MSRICIRRDVYLDKIKGCWLGKNIGGTFGVPFEGKKYVHARACQVFCVNLLGVSYYRYPPTLSSK